MIEFVIIYFDNTNAIRQNDRSEDSATIFINYVLRLRMSVDVCVS